MTCGRLRGKTRFGCSRWRSNGKMKVRCKRSSNPVARPYLRSHNVRI